MNDREYNKRLDAFMDQVFEIRDDMSYDLNDDQFNRFIDIVGFFIDASEQLDITVHPLDSESDLSFGVMADIVVFDLKEEDIIGFSEVFREASRITITRTSDSSICISVVVDDVFKRGESDGR